MVNQLHTKKSVGVKTVQRCQEADQATAKGGLVLVEALAISMRLWGWCRIFLPARPDASQGFQVGALVAALIHGLIAGGRGFSATESLRGDIPLLKALGLKKAPCAKTIERFIHFLTKSKNGHLQLNNIATKQAIWILSRLKVKKLLVSGFLPVWIDGSVLETQGKTKDCLKKIKGRWGQLVVGAFVGPCIIASNFAGKGDGEGEESVAKRLLPNVAKTLRKMGLMKKALVLLDSLYGDDPMIKAVEKTLRGVSYIIGAKGLTKAQTTLAELSEMSWRKTGPNSKRGWTQSGVCQCWIQCDSWEKRRLLVGRRWKTEGDMFWTYSGVITNLKESEARIAAKMQDDKMSFEEAIWSLYSHKQAMENYWKDMLREMGMHHPPSGTAKVNAVFFAIAAMAYNLTVGVRRLTLGRDKSQRMTLWRFRRDVIDMACRVVVHARQATLQLLDARDKLVAQLIAGLNMIPDL